MDTKQLTYILEEMEFSAALPHDVLDKLAAASSVQAVSAGVALFREGSANENLYLVRSGLIALEMHVPGRGAVRVLTLGPGEMIGWSSMLAEGKTTADAVAIDDTELVVAPAAKLQELCDANREFGYHLTRRLAEALSKRLVSTRLQLLDLFADAPTQVPAGKSEEEA